MCCVFVLNVLPLLSAVYLGERVPPAVQGGGWSRAGEARPARGSSVAAAGDGAPGQSSVAAPLSVQDIRTAPCSQHLRLPGAWHHWEEVFQSAFGNQEGISCSVSCPTTRAGNVGLRRVTV